MTTTPSSVPEARRSNGRAAAPTVRPAVRYGDRQTGRNWVARTVIGVLAVSAIAAWIWVAYEKSDPAVRGELAGYGEITDTSVDIRWTVVRDPGTAAVCVIRARDKSGTEVGRARVEVPAGPDTTVSMEHRLVTLVRPFTGELLGCHAAS